VAPFARKSGEMPDYFGGLVLGREMERTSSSVNTRVILEGHDRGRSNLAARRRIEG
jgi:hypothetical protein